MTEGPPSTDWLVIINRVVGTVLWFPVLGFYASSGLVAPLIGVLALWILGAIWLGIGARWWHSRSLLYAASPVLALATWVMALTIGDQFLGWTA